MDTLDLAPLLASFGPQLTQVQACRIFTLGSAAVVFVMMELARRLGESNLNCTEPATPSANEGPSHKTSCKNCKTMQPLCRTVVECPHFFCEISLSLFDYSVNVSQKKHLS